MVGNNSLNSLAMNANPGDVFWLQPQPGVSHPHVVIQDNGETVVLCSLTTNMKKAQMPGNVLLEIGEANLKKQSIVEVSKVRILSKDQLRELIGTLSTARMVEIAAGIQFLQKSYFT